MLVTDNDGIGSSGTIIVGNNDNNGMPFNFGGPAAQA